MQHSEKLDQLFTALAKFQSEVTSPDKTKKVDVKKNGKFLYSFEYAPFGEVLNVTKKLLAKHGLSAIQTVDTLGVSLVLTHESGQWMKTDAITIPINESDMTDAQKLGSAITYIKRYQYNAFFSIDAENDDDSNISLGNEAVPKDNSNTKKAKKQTKKKAKEEPKPEPKEQPKEEPKDESDGEFDSVDEFLEWLDTAEDRVEVTKAFQKATKSLGSDKRKEFFSAVQEKLKELS